MGLSVPLMLFPGGCLMQIKVFKFLINDTVIDITFERGGMYAVTFLQDVSRCIGRNSLFLRSIILVRFSPIFPFKSQKLSKALP